MPSSYPVPKERTVEQLLASLLPKSVRVKREPVDDPQRDSPGLFAEYVTDDERVAMLCYANHELVNSVGAAMVDVDPAAALDATAKSTMHDDCVEGFQEVVNVLATTMNSELTPHVRFNVVRVLPSDVTEEMKALWRSPRARRSFRVSVNDYGVGSLVFYAG